ncbi:hypothetical protein ACLMJK_006691 [Lecanora helva]
MTSPITPRPTSSYGRGDEHRLLNKVASTGESETPNGLGNLADELAEAFDEADEGELGEEVPSNGYDGGEVQEDSQPMSKNGETISPLPKPLEERSLSPSGKPSRSKNHHHHRQKPQYDGSDYGDDSDLEPVDGISPALEARLAAIDSLTRQGTDSNGSDSDNDIRRVVEHLKDLGSQSHIENGASRLITTQTALTSHISNQTQRVAALINPLMSPLSTPPDPDFIEDILPLLAPLTAELPTPSSQPLSSLHGLHASTAELTSMLTYLSDTLYMTRQTTSLASRRLRSATEMVVEMRREAEAREETAKWLQQREWERRLAERECAKVCGDVIGGFEETCNWWRERLLGGLEVGAA